MLLTENDLERVREVIEASSELDPELTQKCGPLILIDAPDDAALKAFVILENRLRTSITPEALGGKGQHANIHDVINIGLKPGGVLAVGLDLPIAEAEGLRDLFVGAFKALRNPAAHGRASRSMADAKATIGLVNMLLGVLEQATKARQPAKVAMVPNTVESHLARIDDRYDAETGQRLRSFVQAALDIGLRPQTNMQYFIGFRGNALRSHPNYPNGQKAWIPAFYVELHDSPNLLFPVKQYQAAVRGFDTTKITKQLKDLGAKPLGKYQDPAIDVRKLKNQAAYKQLLNLVQQLAETFEHSLV